MSNRPLQEYLPPLKARGMIELVGSKRASCALWYLIPTPASASSYALAFSDAEGNAVQMADADYVIVASSEGRLVEPDESTKTVNGVTLLSKDYTGSAADFTNAINIQVIGRLADQPETQL